MSASPAVSTRHFAIIGGGVGGALVAVHLLRLSSPGTRITLIERHPPIGRGVAYGTECGEHLLNVPAGRMSVFADDPGHFLRWVQERIGRLNYPDQAGTDDFLPRRIFGDYMASVFIEARAKAADGVQFNNVTGEAVDIEEMPDGRARITLADERTLDVDRVVLALGNLPGEYPIRKSMPFFHGRRYVHVPWQADVLDGIGKDQDVLIVGAGLTASDIVVQLDRLGHHGVVHVLSRRGLRPRAHQAGLAPHPPFLNMDELPTTVRETLRRVRAEIRAGGEWRAVIDSLRPFSQALWRGFSWEERARFMRHARPFWEAHRHRIAPQVAAIVQRLEAQGRVRFYAGRIQSLRETETGAEAVFRRRGTQDLVTLCVAKVINCTGPRMDYSKFQHPLFINLLARGLIDHDPLALGLNATAEGEVCRYRGAPSGLLFTLGAPLKGVLWESTAVPELRVQARALAEKLVGEQAEIGGVTRLASVA